MPGGGGGVAPRGVPLPRSMDDHLPPESVITFDRNAHACSLEKGRASAAEMPRARLLTETDVPFAHPEGQKAIITFADLWAEPAVGVDD
jgi:hypothetical protein